MELGSPDFLQRLELLLDSNHRAAIVHESDVASGFWATCKALERSCYRGTDMEAARVTTRELFMRVGGYDESVSTGEDFFITKLYERETQIASDERIFVWHHIGQRSLGSLLSKKVAYGRSAKAYLRRAKTVGAGTEGSIVWTSLAAYFKHWRLIYKHPFQYLGIYVLRSMEFMAIELGILFGTLLPRESWSRTGPPEAQDYDP